ncbi:hypothetical protein Tco_0112207 [Tanacetum coccineum]
MDEGGHPSTLEPATNEEVDDVMPDDIDNFSDGDDFYDDFNPLFQYINKIIELKTYDEASSYTRWIDAMNQENGGSE